VTEFWETNFNEKQEMWGWEPADSSLLAVELFKKHSFQKILIPGFGYGRNAKAFMDQGFEVTGIEISAKAIELARKHLGQGIKVHHGPVSAMPFDQEQYDGVFCYALLHLLNASERKKLIKDCFRQVSPGGYLVFVSISKLDPRYGRGTPVGKDQFETWPGLHLFFYDPDSINEEFDGYGLVSTALISEPMNDTAGQPRQSYWYIICEK